jgi:hypothetical protein
MASESGPLTKFTLFPQLPIELRYKIWDATMEGRIVEVVYNEDDDFYYTEAAKPVALSLCQGSRHQALLNYDLLILKDIYEPHEEKNALHFKPYFNYKVDTLYLSLAHLEGEKEMRGSEPFPFQGANVYYFLTALTGLPNMATNLRYISFEADSCIPDWLAIGLTALSGLEQVSLVYGDPCCGNDLYAPLDSSRVMVSGQSRRIRIHRTRRCEDVTHHLPRRDVSRDGKRSCVPRCYSELLGTPVPSSRVGS